MSDPTTTLEVTREVVEDFNPACCTVFCSDTATWFGVPSPCGHDMLFCDKHQLIAEAQTTDPARDPRCPTCFVSITSATYRPVR